MRHLEAFRIRPDVVYRLPTAEGSKTPKLELYQIRARLHGTYGAECNVLDITPVGESLFYMVFDSKHYKDRTARSCMCMQCLRYGHGAVAGLKELVDKISDALPRQHSFCSGASMLKARVDQFHAYLRTDFLRSQSAESTCALHCTTYALCGKAPYNTSCAHWHEMSCERCNGGFRALQEVRAGIEALAGHLKVSMSDVLDATGSGARAVAAEEAGDEDEGGGGCSG